MVTGRWVIFTVFYETVAILDRYLYEKSKIARTTMCVIDYCNIDRGDFGGMNK